jgi:hypothetical protein
VGDIEPSLRKCQKIEPIGGNEISDVVFSLADRSGIQ